MHKQAAFPEAGDWTCAILEARAEKCKLRRRQRRNQNGLNYISPSHSHTFFLLEKRLEKCSLERRITSLSSVASCCAQKYFSSINLDLDGWEVLSCTFPRTIFCTTFLS